MKTLPSALVDSLESAYALYTKPEYLETDPISIPYRFQNQKDIEIVSLLACLFAYGNVKAIKSFVSQSIHFLGKSPYQAFLTQNKDFQDQVAKLSYYRFQTNEDCKVLFYVLSQWIQKREILKKGNQGIWEGVFLNDLGEFQPENSIQRFQSEFTQEVLDYTKKAKLTRGLRFLIGDPNSNSPRKRLCLFLRWMVRTEYPDFGIYSSISPAHLTFPLDVHIQRLTQILGLSKSKTFHWKDSIALRDLFRLRYPNDPLRFDFILTRIGMIQKCQGKYVMEVCEPCSLKKECSIGSATGN